jgi:hypothetical protein
MTLRLGGVGYFTFFSFIASLAPAPLKALEQVCAGPQSAGSIERNLSLAEISGYYWRLDPPFAALVTPGATGSDYPRGHTMGLALRQGQADKLELLFPLDSVRGDPRKAKYSLKLQAKGKTPGLDRIEVFAKRSAGTESFVDSLNRQRTQIIFSPLTSPQLIGDASFLQVASLPVEADSAYETAAFPGESAAKLEGGHWVLWMRLRVDGTASPGSDEATSTLDLGQISLLCHFVDYPEKPLGPESPGVGEAARYLTKSSDNHGFPVEYRWVSIRFWNSLFERGVIEQDWSPSSLLEKSWSLPGLYQLLVTARSTADPEVSNGSQAQLEIVVTPPAPAQITYPSTSDTGKYGVFWSPAAQATAYDLERSSDGGASWARLASQFSTAYSEEAGPGKYRYRVRACAHDDMGTQFCSAFLPGAADVLVSGTPSPSIRRSPDRLDFSAEEGGPNPPSQALNIANGGGGALRWSLGADQGWLLLSPRSGSSTGETDEVLVAADISTLPAGSHEALITLSAPDALNSPQSVEVMLSVRRKSPPPEPPRAEIVSIRPSPADEGAAICFEGSGADADGVVEAFEWTSSLQGLLSLEPAFCRSDLLPGLHGISFRARDDGGLWSAPVQRSLLVGKRISDWPLDGCEARDESGGRDGKIAGTVGCDADRFDRPSKCLSFPGGGSVLGGGLPSLEGDFSLRLWARMDAAPLVEGGTPSSIFQIRPAQAAANVPALAISWDAGASALNVQHGEGAEIRGVEPGWHQIVLSRRDETLAVFLDGAFSGIVLTSRPVGDEFQMGGGFYGALDQVVYERRAMEAGEVEAALLDGGPTVQLRPLREEAELPAYPGTAIEGITLRLRVGALDGDGGDGQAFHVKRLRVSGPLAHRAGEGGFVEGGSLFLERGSSGEGSRTLVGRLEPAEEARAPGAFDLSQVSPQDLPPSSEVKLTARFDLAPGAPIGESFRFSIKSSDDLEVEPAFVAGPRRSGAAAVEGRRFRLAAPPAVRLAAARLEDTGGADGVLLHGLSLQVDSVEDLVLESLLYRKVEGTTLDGVREAVLYVDKNLNGNLEPDEKAGDGIVDPDGGGIRFGGLAGSSREIVLMAGSAASLFLVASIETAQGAAPLRSAPLAVLLAVLLGGAAFFLVLPVWLRRGVGSRRCLIPLEALVAMLFLSVSVALGGGCGGGGGGKGARGTVERPPEIEVGLLGADDLVLRGSLTGAPVILRGLPDGGLIGPPHRS